MLKQCLIALGFKDAYSSNYRIFSRGGLITPKGVIPKIWFVVLEEYHITLHSEKLCAIVKDIFYVRTNTMCFLFKNIFWKGHCVCKRVHFWHRSRLRHGLLQWDVLPFEKRCACWREHSLQRDAPLLFKGVFQSILTCVNLRVWPNNVNIKISSTHSLAANVFAFAKHTFWKLTRTNKIA